MTHKKPAFATLFTIICLSGIVCITISMSVISFVKFHTIASGQVENELTENIAHVRDVLTARIESWGHLVQRGAFGIAPFMAQKPADVHNVLTVLRRLQLSQQDVRVLYVSGNELWTNPGGFMVYSDARTPSITMDNTTRAWFRGAKASPGQVVYGDPFVTLTDGSFAIPVSTIVYDNNAHELGVLAGSVGIDPIKAMLTTYSTFAEQEFFLLNKEGYVLTDLNADGTLKTDFFADPALESCRDGILLSPSFFQSDKTMFIYSVSLPNTNWVLAAKVPRAVVFNKLNSVLIKMIGIDLALIIIAMAICIILTGILGNERDENTAMKDNLDIGFFLLDKRYLIQGQYSKALEQVFGTDKLRGKNFITLLSDSLNETEQTTLKDYFDMILHQEYDQDLLDDINPIQELAYTEGKTLSCGFTGVCRGRKDMVILGSIIDITTEKELKDRLIEEESKRQEDMRFLFEVIQAEPAVLRDFIDDMDHGFDTINSVLTNDDVTPKDASVSLYQEIHAIKSNAIILGLTTFGEKLHVLESNIRDIRDRPLVQEEDLFGLYEGIRRVKQDRGKVMEAIKKIQSFKTSKIRSQSEYVLVESLKKACAKVAADLEKSVTLVVDHIDPETVENGPRRVMKEMLMQLIRNAVYHGIETPQERQAQGKDETGVITLSITHDKDMIQIRLRDNGKGLDYAKIRAKAERLKLLPPAQGDDGGDSDDVIQAIFAPGFSTAGEVGMHAGRGIGLNLVKDRVEALGGAIAVHSEPYKGTEFLISIPLSAAAAVSQAS